jgi:hypothetical protein
MIKLKVETNEINDEVAGKFADQIINLAKKYSISLVCNVEYLIPKTYKCDSHEKDLLLDFLHKEINPIYETDTNTKFDDEIVLNYLKSNNK